MEFEFFQRKNKHDTKPAIMKSKRSFDATIIIVSILLLATVVYFRQRTPSPLSSATKAVVTTSSVATNKAEPTNQALLPQASATSLPNSRLAKVDLIKELVGL